jgi:hypothetical protein
VEKVIRDGLVAVVYSPGYGAGWYSWNLEQPGLLFDPNIVKYVEDGCKDSFLSYMGLKYPEVFISEFSELAIEWVPVGTQFRVNEYDGDESIIIKDRDEWFVA